MQGYFIALIVIGEKEQVETEFILLTCSAYIKELYQKTSSSLGGKWLLLEVKDADVLDDIKKLIQIRMKHKKSECKD
jgi:hypothetical protein